MRIENGEGAFGFLAETADDWLNSDFMRDVVSGCLRSLISYSVVLGAERDGGIEDSGSCRSP